MQTKNIKKKDFVSTNFGGITVQNWLFPIHKKAKQRLCVNDYVKLTFINDSCCTVENMCELSSEMNPRQLR